MANSKRIINLAKRKRTGDKLAAQTVTAKKPQEIFGQLIGKASHLPADLSTKKFRVLTEK
jgi:hypothetical protein